MQTLEEQASILKELSSKEKESNKIKELEHEEAKMKSELLNQSITQLEQNVIKLQEALFASINNPEKEKFIKSPNNEELREKNKKLQGENQ